MKEYPSYCFYGHHKCATTWIRGFVETVCRYTGMSMVTFNHPRQFDRDLVQHIRSHPVDFLCYTNATIGAISQFGHIPSFHVIRDPRDIIVSGYFSHLQTHTTRGWPELAEYRTRLQNMNKQEGLLEEIQLSEGLMQSLYEWDYHQPHILELRFEDLVINPYDVLVRAFTHLNLLSERHPSFRSSLHEIQGYFFHRVNSVLSHKIPNNLLPTKMPVQLLLFDIFNKSFYKITKGRNIGSEDLNSHYRKGLPGDWRNHFTPAVTNSFKEHYPDLLEKLGYESSNNWS